MAIVPTVSTLARQAARHAPLTGQALAQQQGKQQAGGLHFVWGHRILNLDLPPPRMMIVAIWV